MRNESSASSGGDRSGAILAEFRFPLTRRRLLQAGMIGATASFSPHAMGLAPAPLIAKAPAPGEIESHGLSTFGDLAEPADYKHFGYVNPNAPKGGTLALSPPSPTYDTFNAYVLRGNPATGMSLVFDSLMNQSLDERDAYYGLVAKKVRISPDKLTYTFLLRKEARFHDGAPLTAHDAAFSLNILKEKGHPVISQMLRDLASATATADDVLVVKFAPGRTRDLPLSVVSQPIFSKAYYKNRDFEATTLEPPLGSGPYKVGAFEQGISTSSASNISATARSPSKRSRPVRSPSARRISPASGPPAMNFPPHAMAASNARSPPTTIYPAFRVGSSTHGARFSAIRVSERRLATPSISSGRAVI